MGSPVQRAGSLAHNVKGGFPGVEGGVPGAEGGVPGP